MELTTEQLKNVCKVGCGKECCRYVIGTAEGIICGKTDPEVKTAIDTQVSHMSAQGDNCEGIK